jgi:hypothetical protein
MKAEQQLAALLWQQKRLKYPSMPDFAIPKPIIKIHDSNSLTKAIIQTFEAHGLYATRIQSQGQYDPALKRFRTGNTKKGTADIHGIIAGKHVSVEVKYGKDKMSGAQRKTADQVAASGGVYYIARDFGAFWNWFHDLKEKGR